jgi:hypothetical protein
VTDNKKEGGLNEEDFNISPLREASLQMHEMYCELTRAGFTRRQAVTIVAHILAAGVHEGMDEYGSSDGQEDLDE